MASVADLLCTAMHGGIIELVSASRPWWSWRRLAAPALLLVVMAAQALALPLRLTRGQLLLQHGAAALAALTPSFPGASLPPQCVVLPLVKASDGSWFTNYAIDGQLYRAIVDTGSPFITVPGSCTRLWGCYKSGSECGLDDTVEVFASSEGTVQWRTGLLELGSLKSSPNTSTAEGVLFTRVIFGVLSDELVARPGGVWLGLIKRREDWIRPTFLGQTDFVSIRMNFPKETLVLSRKPLIARNAKGAVCLADLRPQGDPVGHYAALASHVEVNGRRIGDNNLASYVIFDSGLNGVALSRALYDCVRQDATSRQERRPFGEVEVYISDRSGNLRSLRSVAPITTALDIPWDGFDANLIVLGVEFLESLELTIDVDNALIHWHTAAV